MAEPEADPTYETLRTAELCVLAGLASEFRAALLLGRIPTDTIHEFMLLWLEDELSGGEGAYDSDD